DLLRGIQECVVTLVEAAERSGIHAENVRRQSERLQDLLNLAESERDKAQAESARERQRAHDLAASIAQAKLEAENERKRLAQQISANASGRIVEFKNKLGLTLSRLVVDLPSKETRVDAELGKILLLQFHQFLDALRQEGIETLSSRGLS